MRHSLLISVILLLILTLAGTGCMTTQPPSVTPTETATPTVTPTVTQAANLTADEQRVFAFVTEAVEYAREQGKEKALAEFNNKNGSFIRDDLYIFAADYNGISLASIALPDRVNTSFYDEVDVSGQYYMRNKINLSRSGGGFIIIHFPNPAHGMAVEPKLCYVHDVDGTYWIGAGTYNQTNVTAKS
jgi:polar amino acid transport system substrate-binding protein